MTHTPKQPDSNGPAIASLVLGILSLTGFGIITGIPAIILGAMALKNPVNKGMGIAGLIMGGISTILTVLVILFFLLFMILGAFAASEYEQAPRQSDTPGQFDMSEQRSI